MDISSVYGDIFRACTIKSISYRVYALKSGTQQTRHDEFVGNGALHRAEVALRYEDSRLMTSLSLSGDELWVYVWEEEDSKPSDQKLSIPYELLDTYNAETVAQGIFLPPFTGGVTGGFNLSRNISSNTLSNMTSFPAASSDDQSRYGPLVRAIELKFLDTLLRNGDPKQYEAFGTKAALSTGDGAVIRLRPILHQDGSLVVRLTSQKAQLIPLPLNGIQMCAPLVWLLPHGKPCRILSSLRYEEVFEPPNRARARSLYYLLTSYSVTNVTLSQLESSMWLRVSSADTGGDLLWPVVLIRATPLTSSGYNLTTESSAVASASGSNNGVSSSSNRGPFPHTNASSILQNNGLSLNSSNIQLNNRANASHLSHNPSHRNLHSPYDFPARRPLVKILKPSPYTSLTHAMMSVRTELRRKRSRNSRHPSAAADPESAVEKLHQTLNRPIAPPPSPRASTAVPSLAPTAVPTAAPTPTALTPSNSTPVNTHIYPTPTYHTPAAAFHTPAYGTPQVNTPALPQDAWMNVDGEDDEEVGDADFNFFDLPLNQSQGNARNDITTGVNSIEASFNGTEPKVEIINSNDGVNKNISQGSSDIPPQKTSDEVKNEYGTSKETTKDLHGKSSSAADQVKPRLKNFASLDLRTADLDSKYTTGGRFFVPPPAQDEYSSKSEASSESTNGSDESSDSDSDEMNGMMFDEESDMDVSESQLYNDPAAAHDFEEMEKSWLKFIRHEDAKYLPIDTSKFLSFRQLLPQIVYDSGLLSEMYEAPVVSGQTIVAPEYVCKRLPWDMYHCPIGSTANDSGYSPTRSRSSTPAGISVPVTPSTQGGNSSQKRMQLLSPPLVAIRRGKFMLRARVSILRFWRLLSLSPPLPALEDPNQMLFQERKLELETDPSKDINSDVSSAGTVVLILITLASSAVVDGARRALNGIKGAYEGCRLGKIELPTFGQVENGIMLINADLGHTSGDAVGDLFQTACNQLKTQLQTLSDYGEDTNLLIFMSYPPSSLRGGTLTAIVPFQLAQGFATIQGSYPESQWMLSSLESLVSRWDHDKQISEYEFEKFAMLVYSRFPRFPQPFRLTGLVPHSSGLQYTMEPPQYLMEDEPVLHVAYLIVEGRWCLTSWSDQWARKVDIDVLKLSDNSERSLQLVFAEILRHSDNLARKIKDRPGWRFSITKCGTMAASETAVWERVIQQDTPVILMDIPHPRGVMVADHRSARPIHHNRDSKGTTPSTAIGTPSTGSISSASAPMPSASPVPPMPSMPSPHPSSLGSSSDTGSATATQSPSVTPASPMPGAPRPPPAKADAVIVDATDEIYGTSIDAPKAGVSRYAEASAQGYLVRPSVEGHVALEARLLQIFGLNAVPRVVMSRVIGQFRRLASLSEFMGVTTESTLVPWHVMALAKLEAAALKLNML